LPAPWGSEIAWLETAELSPPVTTDIGAIARVGAGAASEPVDAPAAIAAEDAEGAAAARAAVVVAADAWSAAS
jgi:hypothetical protein